MASRPNGTAIRQVTRERLLLHLIHVFGAVVLNL